MKTTKKPKNGSISSTPIKNDSAKTLGVKVDAPKTTVTKASEPKAEAPKAAPKTELPTMVAAKSQPQKPAAPKPNHVLLELVKPEAKSVCVAGSFNQWKPENTPLAPQGNGRWVGDLNVKPGRHEYLFVVDGQWVPDPNAKESVENPFGGRNSVLIVSE
jgi:hypothetical protein